VEEIKYVLIRQNRCSNSFWFSYMRAVWLKLEKLRNKKTREDSKNLVGFDQAS